MKISLLCTLTVMALASCQTHQGSVEPSAITIPQINAQKTAAEKRSTQATSKPAKTIVTKPTIKPYTSKLCPVTDEPRDAWDEEVSTVYKNQEIKLCCNMCLKKFNKSPETYLAKINS